MVACWATFLGRTGVGGLCRWWRGRQRPDLHPPQKAFLPVPGGLSVVGVASADASCRVGCVRGAVASRPEALQKTSRVDARLRGGQLWLALAPVSHGGPGDYHKSLSSPKKQGQATEASHSQPCPPVRRRRMAI